MKPIALHSSTNGQCGGPLLLRIYPPTTKKATGTPRFIDRLARFMWEIGAFGELHATTTQETSEAKGILVTCMSVDPESWVWFSAWACVESETMGHGRLRSLAGRETDPSCTPLCVWASLRVNTDLALTSLIAMLAGRLSPETPGLRLRMLTSRHLVTASKTNQLSG
ncbi:hypothetical protein BO86DRAFT_114112 [Aspergillus japonicus CBS 114.51]|uniref:Uncharacterized protein n=2 Tax=Aspergillus TaxID=5052 RepID=A0A2V5HC76_ASPV1|nr:hypothetical protein BO86DRAFT_114112 [Aspergillus japonicus CBS 114.51]PYI21969.1 hypothetical protein BO99DRAFT_41178 [Aspergillus violaceofuscus CBS 115571]RAH86560.1 hypothetical protein BO86DRAFT_114112 [Aspergillus japonicus CBS 114.51]